MSAVEVHNGHGNGHVPRGLDMQRLPHNVSAEASILGGIIIENDVLDALPELEPSAFFSAKHRVVFSAMRNLRDAGSQIDVLTLELEIERQGKLDAVGGIAFLGELVANVPVVANVLLYAAQVTLLARNRKVVETLATATERALAWPHDPSELLDEAIGDLTRIQETRRVPQVRLITIAEALQDLEQLSKAPIYKSPFETLNQAIGFGGFLGTQVYTVAAGTGRGKTSWVAAIAAHAAETVPVIVATYEMQPGYFVARRAAGLMGTHSNAIIQGKHSIADVLRVMPYPRMFLMRKPTLKEIRAGVEQLKKQYGVAPLVIVDYLQKLADEIATKQARIDLRLATSEASATLLDIGDTTGAAIISVSAIGRGKRALSSPRKLEPYELVEVAKESGAVEYDGAAMIVLSLSNDMDGEERIGTMTVAKARFGREMHIEARYNGPRGTWRELGEVSTKVVSNAEIDAACANVTPLRESILAVLRNKGAQPSATKLAKQTGKQQQAAFDEIKLLINAGLIERRGGMLQLPTTVHCHVEATSPLLPGLIRAAENEAGS